MYSRMINLATTTSIDAEDMVESITQAATYFASTPATARAVLVLGIYDKDQIDNKVVAAVAALQHSGVRVIAVVPRVAADLSIYDSTVASKVGTYTTLHQKVSALVSDPLSRNMFFVHEGDDHQGAFMDLSLPHQQPPNGDSISTSRLLMPFDPRSADTCVTPHVCMIGASGLVRSFLAQNMRIGQHGEFVLASYRTPTHGVVDIFAGAGRCPAGVEGACITKVSVVPRDLDNDFTTIRAVSGGIGATVSEGQSGYSTFFNEDAPTDVSDSASSDRRIQLSAVHVSPTWVSTNQARPSGNGSHPISSYHITIRDPSGVGSGSVYVDADNGVLAVTIVVGAEATPTRVGLCGVPAGAIGEDASPADRLPRHTRYAAANEEFLGDDSFSSTVATDAQAGATRRRPCPPTSESFRLFDTTDDGLERVHVHSRLTDNDFATLERLERLAAGSDGTSGQRDSLAARLPSRYYGSYQRLTTRTAPTNENCVRAFGEDSFLNNICESHAETGASFGVFSTLRTASNLCRMRCLHPDGDRPAVYKLSRGGATQAALRVSTSGTEILDDLVAPSWCEANVCELLKPMMPVTRPAYDTSDNTYGGSKVEPSWFILSSQKTRDEYGYINKIDMLAFSNSHAAIVTPPQGGQYVLQASVNVRSCVGAQPNVTVNARCPRVLDTPYAGENVTVERKGDSFPYVSLHGQVNVVEGLAVPPRYEVWWSIAEYPKSPVEDYVPTQKAALMNGKFIVYPRTTTPLFAPPHAGLWKVSFSVFDGCAVRTSYVNVVAKCGASCSPSVRAREVTTGVLGGSDVAIQLEYSRSGSANGMDGLAYPMLRVFNVSIDKKAFAAVPAVGSAVNTVKAVPTATTVSRPTTAGVAEAATVGSAQQKWDASYLLGATASESVVLAGQGARTVKRELTYSSVGSTETIIHTAYPVLKPTQCSLADKRDLVVPGPLSATTYSVPSTLSRWWPQVSTYEYDMTKYMGSSTSATPSAAAGAGHVCDSGKNKHRIESDQVAGNIPMYGDMDSSNTPHGIYFSTLRFDEHDNCPVAENSHGKVWLHTSRQKMARTVAVTMRAASGSYNLNETDGFYPIAAWVEYRELADEVAASSSWNDTRAADDAGEWKAVRASYITMRSGSQETMQALVPGQSVVRVIVEVRPYRYTSVYMTAVEIEESVHVDHSVCNGQHVTGKVQVTDGCVVAEDRFETSFECPVPPQIELTTPHFDIDFDYESGTWPTVPMTAFQTLTDGLNLAFKSVDSQYTENTADFSTFAYTNVDGYATASVDSAFDKTISFDSWGGTYPTRAPCLNSIAGSGFRNSGWIHRTNSPTVPQYNTYDASKRQAEDWGPHRDHPWGGRSLVVATRCASLTEDTVYHMLELADLPVNVTHVNVSYYVHATHGGGNNEWSIDFASYSSRWDTFAQNADFKHGTKHTTPLQTNVYDGWKAVHHIVPVSTFTSSSAPTRLLITRLWYNSTDPRAASGALAVDKYIALSDIHVKPAYVGRTAESTAVKTVRVHGEGVARFGVHIENVCHKRSLFVDVAAKCKHDIEAQHIEVYSTTPDEGALIANSSVATAGSKKIRGVPNKLAEVVIGVIDGVKTKEGTGNAYGVLTLGDDEIAYAGQGSSPQPQNSGQYKPFVAYGDGASSFPWNSTSIAASDIIGGVYGAAQLAVTRAGNGKVIVRSTDGCRWREDSVDVEYVCSDTVWTGSAAHYAAATGDPATALTEVNAGSNIRIVFTVKAEHAAEQADGTLSATRTSVDSAAWRRVEVVSSTPANAGGSVRITGATSAVWKMDSEGTAYGWQFAGSAGDTAAFSTSGEGTVKVRVTYGFTTDCSAPAEAFEFDIKINNVPCLPYTAVATRTTDAKFQSLVDITLKDYPIADFTNAASPKRKEAMVAALNAEGSPVATLVADATAVQQGADAVVTLTLRFDDSDIHFDKIDDELKKFKSFQRTFGYISSSTPYSATLAPTNVVITWTGDTAPTLQNFWFRSRINYDVCGASAAACPAFVSKTLTVAVDPTKLPVYKTINPGVTRLWNGDGAPQFSVPQTAGCDIAVDLFDECANLGAATINPVGAVGVVEGASIAAADVKPDAPGTVAYAKDEPRTFQRVYLTDDTPTPDWLYDGEDNLHSSNSVGYPGPKFRSEWVVIEAPQGSVYAPNWGNATTAYDRSTEIDFTDPIYFTTAYATTDASPWSAYVVDEGVHHHHQVAVEKISNKVAASFETAFVRIANDQADCLRPSSIVRNPRGEACWTPDVAGKYVIGYRADVEGCSGWSGSPYWLNKTLTFNAVCPAFEAKFAADVPSVVKFGQHLGLNPPTDTVSLHTARINVGVDVAGASLPDHMVYTWSAERVGEVPGSLPTYTCNTAKWQDGHDANTTVIFECPGRWNVSVFVTDGCSKKTITQMVDVTCGASELLQAQLPNITFNLNIPEGGDVGTYGTVEVPYGTAAAMKALQADTTVLPCMSSLSVQWKVVDYVPHPDEVATGLATYEPELTSRDNVFITGSAGEARAAALTTGGDVLTTIMVFAIVLAVLVTAGVSVYLVVSGREAMQQADARKTALKSSGVVHPTEPAAVGPSASYGDAPPAAPAAPTQPGYGQ